jgi:transcriptional regulator with XRE-family HTH domain
MKIHQKVKIFRESNNLSQENMAYELGLNQSQYSRRENGIIKFDAEEIGKIAVIFCVSTDELLNDKITILDTTRSKSSVQTNLDLAKELLAQYEDRLKEKDLLIEILRERILFLEKLIISRKSSRSLKN